MAVERRGEPAALELAAEQVAQLGAFAVVLLADAGAADVLGDHRGVQVHRAVAGAEEAGAAGRHVAAFGGEVERDVIGHLAAFQAQLAGQDGAEIGIIEGRLAHAAAHHDAARRSRGRRCAC